MDTVRLPSVALSIRQPWAWAIMHAGKDIENRSWSTTFRGSFCIHAARGMTRDEFEDFIATVHDISITHPFLPGLTTPAFGELTRGAIVGTAEIVDCVAASASPWFFGRYGFVIRHAAPLAEPISVKGALGFFDWRHNLPDAPNPAQGALL